MLSERSVDDLPIIERKLHSRELRFPKGINNYITRLREEGRLKDAIKSRRKNMIRKMTPKKELEVATGDTLRELIISDSLVIQALSALKLTWILSATGEIEDSQREADIYTIHRNWPNQSEMLQTKDVSIVFEVSNLVERANNS